MRTSRVPRGLAGRRVLGWALALPLILAASLLLGQPQTVAAGTGGGPSETGFQGDAQASAPESPTPPPAPEGNGDDDGASSDLAWFQDLCTAPPPPDDPWAVTPALCTMSIYTIVLVNDEGQRVTIPVLLAADVGQRAAGYQFVGEEVIQRTGILFLLSRDLTGAFHMCNVRAPLDMAWFRSDGSLLDKRTVPPGPAVPANTCPALYAPRRSGAYRYVLEMPGGALAEYGVRGPASRLVAIQGLVHLDE